MYLQKTRNRFYLIGLPAFIAIPCSIITAIIPHPNTPEIVIILELAAYLWIIGCTIILFIDDMKKI